MMMGLKAPLKQGEKVPLTLVFEKAGKIDVELAVVAMGASPKHHDQSKASLPARTPRREDGS